MQFQRPLFLHLLFIVTLMFLSCQKTEDLQEEVDKTEESGTLLTLKVFDTTTWNTSTPKGNSAADTLNVMVALYRSKQDFKEKKIFKSAKVQGGSVQFILPEGEYYIAAVGKNGISNLYSTGKKSADSLEMGYVADGIFQTQQEINLSIPEQGWAFPGYFKWKDLNRDGTLDDLDQIELPAEKVTIGLVSVQKEILLGRMIDGGPIVTTLEMRSATDACYSKFYDFQKNAVIFDAVMSDDAGCTGALSAYCSINSLSINPYDPKVAALFKSAYDAINFINAAINAINRDSYVDAGIKKPYLAQLRGLRGYMYLMVAELFGTSPLVTENNINLTAPPSSTSQSTLYGQAKKDLDEALLALPTGYVDSSGRKRISKYACTALRARLALQEKDYNLAENLSAGLLSNSRYKFSKDVNNMLNDMNDEENIWACGTPDDTYYQNLLSRGKYRPVIRLAEMHLINAEALIAQGKAAEAKLVLTVLADRRNYTFRSPVTLSNITKDLQDLWKTEMYQEGQRMRCLHRWNTASEVLGMAYQEHYKLLPIPASELSLNPNIIQNAGYR